MNTEEKKENIEQENKIFPYFLFDIKEESTIINIMYLCRRGTRTIVFCKIIINSYEHVLSFVISAKALPHKTNGFLCKNGKSET